MKQINLALAAAGDVAVLGSGEKCPIHTILQSSFKKERPTFMVTFENKILTPTYYVEGAPKFAYNDWTITDVLRNGASIFETD